MQLCNGLILKVKLIVKKKLVAPDLDGELYIDMDGKIDNTP